MAKPTTQIVTPSASTAIEMPEFMKQKKAVGLEGAADYILVQRLKVVQKMAEAKTLEMYNPADTILVPANKLIAGAVKAADGKLKTEGDPFDLVPMFFFPSWAKVNDLKLKGQEPMFLEY